ncbi:hypothetical protein DTO166G4_8686 [Paecilomyces variotii]|nr:hypothetical protein DTO166G4_8686 [Paecilomyces variotii]KAJ9228605.1 hypothetical protein DTO166G5_8442 [Paecilomyces variotii]KAJ9252677.1 hypothetical protein DTO195F2_7326 [Paecilomyces variotii]KAJ9304814.1 hypothetical protein DTO217A2_5623 [Paecilomyces variotii]KAJ9362793.1 hypothetical protein DTO280E4_3142 [Paecilomyces variotii]
MEHQLGKSGSPSWAILGVLAFLKRTTPITPSNTYLPNHHHCPTLNPLPLAPSLNRKEKHWDLYLQPTPPISTTYLFHHVFPHHHHHPRHSWLPSAARSALKESDQNRDELDKEYEAQKQEQLRSTKEGKAKWKQELASNSEASVKADRGEIDSNQETIDKLQEGTKNLPNREGPVNKAH